MKGRDVAVGDNGPEWIPGVYEVTQDAGLTSALSSIAWLVFLVLLAMAPALVWIVWSVAW